MSADGFRHVLAILDGEPEDYRRLLAGAVELAQVQHARLTLAKTSDAGWLAQCVCVFPIVCVAPRAELEEHARDVLARSAELIPQSISLATLLLGEDACLSLRRLLSGGEYDLVVMREAFLRRRGRLRRVLRRAGVSTLAVAVGPRERVAASERLRPLAPAP
ncbi:MAG TPA: hypothetical protein VL979_04410 [Solirubrobacteraceae bacterium]|nr:hypothetical protein [Solirubrobacteraceae bacterium]